MGQKTTFLSTLSSCCFLETVCCRSNTVHALYLQQIEHKQRHLVYITQKDGIPPRFKYFQLFNL